MEPFQGFHDLICTIPGISTLTVVVVVAETGADMSRFPTAGHLASWTRSAQRRWSAAHTRTPTRGQSIAASPPGAAQ